MDEYIIIIDVVIITYLLILLILSIPTYLYILGRPMFNYISVFYLSVYIYIRITIMFVDI